MKLDLLVSMSNRIAESTAVEAPYEHTELAEGQCRCCGEPTGVPAEIGAVLCENCERLGEEVHR